LIIYKISIKYQSNYHSFSRFTPFFVQWHVYLIRCNAKIKENLRKFLRTWQNDRMTKSIEKSVRQVFWKWGYFCPVWLKLRKNKKSCILQLFLSLLCIAFWNVFQKMINITEGLNFWMSLLRSEISHAKNDAHFS
jgi:hypothetical protein